MDVYILTKEHNQYDQYGEYFIAWFAQKPTIAELRATIESEDENEIISDETAEFILAGGGRQKSLDNIWWYLGTPPSAN